VFGHSAITPFLGGYNLLLFEGGREMLLSIRRWALALSAALAGLNIIE